MSVVWKYPFWDSEGKPTDVLEIEVDLGSRFLYFDFQNNFPTIWLLVSEREEKVVRRFRVFGTGHPIPAGDWHYYGSALGYEGGLVLHLFEEGGPSPGLSTKETI